MRERSFFALTSNFGKWRTRCYLPHKRYSEAKN